MSTLSRLVFKDTNIIRLEERISKLEKMLEPKLTYDERRDIKVAEERQKTDNENIELKKQLDRIEKEATVYKRMYYDAMILIYELSSEFR
jgi:hypothetical protein